MVSVLVIAVFVIAVATLPVGAVQEDDQVVVLFLGVPLVDFRQHALLQEAGADHEDGQVRIAVDDGGIGHQFHRRAVEEHVIVLATDRLDHLGEPGRVQQLGRVRWQRAAGQDVHGAHRHDQLVEIVKLPVQVSGNALVGLPGIARQAAAAEVQIDGQHLLALEGDGRGQVGGDKGLAAARVHGREHDHLVRGLVAQQELQVASNHAEGFVHHVSVLVRDDHRNYILFLRAPPVLLAARLRDFAGEGRPERLQVVSSLDRRRQEVLHEQNEGRNGQT